MNLLSPPTAFSTGATAGAGLSVWHDFRSTIRVARQRVSQGATIAATMFGGVEYARGGTAGAAEVLVIHGAGGGWDQGALIAEALLDSRFRWIAPSRFGYLHSSVPENACVEDQAHAYALVLNRIGVTEAAVIAVSAGGPSALAFALLHPERVSSLTLLSCGVTPAFTAAESTARRNGNALDRVFRSDLGYWCMTRFCRHALVRSMGVDDEVIAQLSSAQRAWVNRFIDGMHPATFRRRGIHLDRRMKFDGERIREVHVPTLIVHAEDDRLQPFANATFAAAAIPGARLQRFSRGGHMVMLAQQPAVRALVIEHVLQHDHQPLEARDDQQQPIRRHRISRATIDP
jgi:2-hydroxy-6-oxonona-2,4-dienedioate hydrolase